MTTDPGFAGTGMDPTWVQDLVGRVLAEDLGVPSGGQYTGHDVTGEATIPADQQDTAVLVARASGVLGGLPLALAVFLACSSGAEIEVSRRDGDIVERDDVVARITGLTRGIVAAERSALNLLCHASGIATLTRAWVGAVEGTGVRILDTRKTTSGLRPLDKYAVRVGGGQNKRMGLHDVAMIKDNHVLAAGGVVAAINRVRQRFPDVPLQVEVTTVNMAHEALEAGAPFLLCDNMQPELLRAVVAAVDGRAELEATGGLSLDRAREYAETGVDYLSVGALTHSAPILDLALDVAALDLRRD
ncbi:MAG: carboxylating nicotinate-nucleotide diphosphorylase [Geodermatophilaceae bacterium]|nr:carboxylating nicotinate-nucleotide diphosphorylase [Geodermatophilaceae bacterium]